MSRMTQLRRLLGPLAALFVALSTPALAQTVSRYQAPSSAAEASHVVCNGGCISTGFQVNSGAVAVWVLAYDARTVPVDGTVAPVKWYQLAANNTLGVSFGDGLTFNAGLTLVCSTTGPLTQTSTATCIFSGDRR